MTEQKKSDRQNAIDCISHMQQQINWQEDEIGKLRMTINDFTKAVERNRRPDGLSAEIMQLLDAADKMQLVLPALKSARHELNTIRARDGVPYTHYNMKSDVTDEYFSDVVERCNAAIDLLEGKDPK